MSAPHVEPLDTTFGAVVRDVDLTALDDDTVAALVDQWHEHALLIFPGQHLTPDQQNAFARRLGPLEFEATPLTNVRQDGSLRAPDHDLSKSLRGNERWHHDSTYMPIQARGAVFSAEIVPTEGGSTGFADMRAGLDALDDETRASIADLAAHHSRRYSMERAGLHIDETDADRYRLYGYDHHDAPPLRPLVKAHTATGEPHLTIGQHAFAIPGLPPDESAALLDRLERTACADDRVHHHQWSVGDTVLWDNLRLMHRATPHDPAQARRMWHTRLAGDPVADASLAA